MFRHHPKGEIVFALPARVGFAAQCLDFLQNRVKQVGLENTRFALHDKRDSVKSHARVVVLFREGCENRNAVFADATIKHRENVVAEFKPASRLIIYQKAFGRGQRSIGAHLFERCHAVKILGTRSTGAVGAVFDDVSGPVVFVGLKSVDSVFAQPDDVVPDTERLIVLFVNGDVESLCIDSTDNGEKLPRPRNHLCLKIIAERKIAEHLKKSTVRGVAYRINIACTNTFLDGTNSAARWNRRSRKIRLELLHSRRGEQGGGVGITERVYRGQGRTGQL